MINIDDAALVKANLANFPDSDRDFAKSLMKQLENQGALSRRQWFWVGKLAKSLKTSAAQPQPDMPATVSLGDFSNVIELFKLAGEKLKYPKIVLQLPDKTPVVMAVAGVNSQYPGTVTVSDGKSWGKGGQWFGRVTPEGQWEPGKKIGPETMTAVQALLTAFAKSPADVAAEYGHLTGLCCFCGSVLSDDRSTTVGYGPVCAKRWGMPWGSK